MIHTVELTAPPRLLESVGESAAADQLGQPLADLSTEYDPILGQIERPIDGLGLRRGSQESLDALDLRLIDVKILAAPPRRAAGSPRC